MRARLSAVVVLAALAAFVPAGTAVAGSVAITKVSVHPGSITGAAQHVKITLKTKGATSCRISSSPALKGLPAAMSCRSGTSHKTVAVPANNSTSARTYVFTVSAGNSAVRTTTTVRLRQGGKPVAVTSFSAKPGQVSGERATAVRVLAKLRYGATCTLQVKPALHGLPISGRCSNGHFGKTITVPPQREGGDRTFIFSLIAKNASGGATISYTSLLQKAVPGPAISKIATTPAKLTVSGGRITVSAAIAHAKACTITTAPNIGSTSARCANGRVSGTYTVPPALLKGVTYTFTIKANGVGGRASKTISRYQPGPLG